MYYNIAIVIIVGVDDSIELLAGNMWLDICIQLCSHGTNCGEL